ncbi:FG-GAP-like repeat-containing protein [Streptomyces albidoflavus]
MRAHHAPRALRLASALVAAGLCLSAAPPALAAGGDDGARKLSSAEAKDLAARLSLDAYGDAADTEDAPQAEEAPEAASPKAAGRGTAAADTKVTLTETAALEGVRGMGATVPVGKKGDYFTVHSLGNVQRHAADGSAVWERTNTSLYADWQVEPVRPWQTEPFPARVLMGYNAVSPFSPTSDSGYSTGDLTGDGVDDLVFSASVGITPYRPFTSPGSSLPNGTFVTVLDGKTGRTLWSKLYNYASMVKIVDGTLLVADAPRLNMNAPETDTARLTGIRFSLAGGALTESSSWTYDSRQTGTATWGDIQRLSKGKAVVSWDLARTATTEGRGRTLALDLADGSVTWQTDSLLYSRQLRVDAARKRVVAVEQADVNDGVRYELAAYDTRTGRRATLDSRVNVLPTALTVGDLTAKEGAEYAVAESSLDNNLYVNASTVRVLNGAEPGKVLWSDTVKRDAGHSSDGAGVWRLEVADGRLVTSGQDDREVRSSQNIGGSRFAATTVYSRKGVVSWRLKGTDAAPMYHDVYADAAGTHLRLIDQSQNIRTFKLGNGKQQQVTPMQGDIAHAQATDLDKDGNSDVVMGGTSNGVWAYSGPSLAAGKPEKLWRATVPGAVHDIQTGDVNGDGRPEIVVAADTAVVVLNGRNGRTLATIDGGGQFIHSAKLADLDGDGAQDIVVPTGKVSAYHGDGRAMWSYTAPKSTGDVVFSDPSVADGRVYTSYSKAGSLDLADPAAHAVALNAKTGKAKWAVAPKAPEASTDGVIHGALTHNATFASPEIPYADGHAVVHVWAVMAQAGTGSTDATSLQQYLEIRDGRTGEVVHSALIGGLWTHSNFFTDDGILYQAGTAALRSFGADGDDHMAFVVPQSYAGGFATGPGGVKLLVAGVEGGLYAWDAGIVAADRVYPESAGSAGLGGGRNHLAADLDGDGVDELLSLNGDDYGLDRIAENLGGRYLIQDNAVHQVSVFTLS